MKIVFQDNLHNVNVQQPNYEELLCYHSLSSHKNFSSNKRVHNF